ncbi:hypothetical protein [Jiella marina]|uniref:hypothetical protein n=1 Tax=Jiella sp. LLJ827 TaxID=2917712 RepID=UPI0021017386|nr:hypothetical protein [Jiella sp. LLJ827]MCQ0989320.1 hypothetical protein [Jiella sp. LLJ827]
MRANNEATIPAWLKSLAADRQGSVSIIAGIVLPVAVIGLGFGAETGIWYYKQRLIQHAADVGAHAAAVRKRSGASYQTMRNAALFVASESGYTGTNDAFIVNDPPTSGPNQGIAGMVEVKMTIDQPRLFSAIISSDPLTFSGRAVAKISEASKACILALDTTSSGAVTASGSTSVALDGCDIASNSNAADAFAMGGDAAVETGCVVTVGEAATTSALTLNECAAPKENAPLIADPYRDVVEPAVQGTCIGKNVGNTKNLTTLTPGENHPSGITAMRFCSGLQIKGDTHFDPGLYIIEGGTLTVNGDSAKVTGEGVTFFLTAGAEVKFTGNASLDLAAPTSGPYAGLLFFGGRDQLDLGHTIAGTSDSVLDGAIYLPGSDIKYRGNSSGANGCTQIVANTIDLSGNSSLASNCTANGGRDIISVAAVTLVE